MSNNVKGFTVTFGEDCSEEYMEAVKNSIMLHHGVLHVEPKLVTHDDHMQRIRLKSELIETLIGVTNKF